MGLNVIKFVTTTSIDTSLSITLAITFVFPFLSPFILPLESTETIESLLLIHLTVLSAYPTELIVRVGVCVPFIAKYTFSLSTDKFVIFPKSLA